jgi:pantetheine-phosphate adenylyltransferase
MYQRGLLPLSADPITYGHLDLVRQAGGRCQELLIMVSTNPDKTPTLKDDDRLKLVQKCVADFCPDVHGRVFLTDDILTDVFLREQCDVVFRGARDVHDVEYESLQTQYHNIVLPGIADKTIILAADPKLSHVQSSAVRNFAKKHMGCTDMVPVAVQARLWRRIFDQKVIGIMGDPLGIYDVAQGILDRLGQLNKWPIHIIDMAALEKAMKTDPSPGCVDLVARMGGTNIFQQTDPDVIKLWTNLLSRYYRAEMNKASARGIVMVVFPNIFSFGMMHWVNNNVVYVTDNLRVAVTTGWNQVAAESAEIADIQVQQQTDCYGTLIRHDNTGDYADLGNQIHDLIRAGII